MKVVLVTPPFTQLNTPYPATAYLKGFLNTLSISSFQSDLGIETVLKIFSKEGLTDLFAQAETRTQIHSDQAKRVFSLRNDYIHTVDAVVAFLQGRNPTLASLLAGRNYLPEANRFQQLDDLQWAYGAVGMQDKAKHIGTLYLEDISDFIQEAIDPNFGFTRYAERLGRSANSFNELYTLLQQPPSYIDSIYVHILEGIMSAQQPQVVALSVPFPGNLLAAFRCGQWLKAHYPDVKIVMGGGFPNTELRQLSDPRVFEFLDYITLDDGETPITQLLQYIEGKVPQQDLRRTFLLQDGKVAFIDNRTCADVKQGSVGIPDYSDFLLDRYISAIEVVNPMHSLWSDGRWNKLTMAHGCYWGKCTFCDISLDYIGRYEPLTAAMICDKMEAMIAQTGTRGFHFVDEAAPPALMKALAIEIIARKLVVSWWTNIRFEKSFTRDTCFLLKQSGCIAVSGGLEVASDRLLKLIDKGITVAQVVQVNQHFTEAGIMVHAYLMYGFPTQTAQETIDALEGVRQMFQQGILQSGFWHQFAMTTHSPVGMNPDKFGVKITNKEIGTFANNDLVHEDPTGAEHETFSEGLKKSLFNFMHHNCLDYPLQKWFEHKVPKTTIAPDYVQQLLQHPPYTTIAPTAKVFWLGNIPELEVQTKSKKGNTWEVASISFNSRKEQLQIKIDKDQGIWFCQLLEKMAQSAKIWTYSMVAADYNEAGLEDFEIFWENKPMNTLYKVGLYVV